MANAVFPDNVQGVVVQAKKKIGIESCAIYFVKCDFDFSEILNFTVTPGSGVSSLYPRATSWLDRLVSHRGQ